MSITRPPSSSPEEIERIVDAAVRRGASIQMMDPRLTALQTWILTGIGGILIVLGGWMIKSINDLTVVLAQQSRDLSYLQRDQNDLRTEFKSHVNAVVIPPPREQR